MKNTLIYLTHARIPSEKTPSPFILKTCEGFAREGFAVELWVARRHNPQFENVDPFEHHQTTPVPLRWIPTLDFLVTLGNSGFLLIIATFNIGVSAALWKKRKEPGLVVYAHDFRDLILPSLVGIPIFCEVHDFYESSFRMLNRFVTRRVRGFIVTNSLKVHALKEHYHIPPEKMLHQPNAVDATLFTRECSKEEARRELALPQNRRIAMYTGHLYSWKGVYTLAHAAAYLPPDTDIYFVGGTDPDRLRLQTFVEEKNLLRIFFIPHQPHACIPRYLKAADVLVVPNTAEEDTSKYETSPVKLFEYCAAGRPVVASDIPSIRDLVSEKEVLFAFPDNPRDLARVITSAMCDTESIRTMVATARSFAERNSWEHRAKNIRSFITAQMSD